MCQALTFGFLGFWIEDHSKSTKSTNIFSKGLSYLIFIVTEQPYNDLLTETLVTRDFQTRFYSLDIGRLTNGQTIYQAF